MPTFSIFKKAIGKSESEKRYVEKQVCFDGRYILAYTKESLEEKKEKFYSPGYYYPYVNKDNHTVDLQQKVNEIIDEYKLEIDEFYEMYGRAKYNRKDNKAKKDELRKLQKADFERGISKDEYKEKYGLKTNVTFYEHVRKLYPEWISKEDIDMKKRDSSYFIPSDPMTDEMRQDILNGICVNGFLAKYNASDASYYRYKNILETELGFNIKL